MNRNLKMNVVGEFTCRILSDASGEKYDYEHFLITLLIDGKQVPYILMAAFKEKYRDSIFREVVRNNLKDIKNFRLSDRIHVITLYEEKYGNYESISFDKNSNFPIKDLFKDESFEKVFFNKFVDFRNYLIENKEIIKEDDIVQFYLSITGNFNKNKNSSKEKNKVKGKFLGIFNR